MEEALLNWIMQKKKLPEARIGELRGIAAAGLKPLERTLLERKLATEREILQFYALHLGLPYMDNLDTEQVPEEFTRRIPIEFARNNGLVAVGRENGSYRVATARPLDVHPLDDLSELLENFAEPVVAPLEEIASLITRAYQKEGEEVVGEMLKGMEDEEFEDLGKDIEITDDDLLDIANKAPIIKLVNMIIFQAIKMRASDIHIQPLAEKVQVRYRIDGMLYDMMSPPKKVQDAILSRIKVMARLDIAERRLPQDGGFTKKAGNREIDFRVSSIPTLYGERIVMRIQDKSKGIYNLEKVGLNPTDLERMKELIRFTHGIILVTGPTGSGKTTTLYASLSRINNADKNIITIEDPIEYQLSGVSQIEVSTKKGMTFATGLRSIVRQDPDIIMVGEIRDLETADVAIQAALTGHLVFSTLHTNDAPGAVTRLLDLGVEPFLVSSSVIAVIAQRLVRLICNECKEAYEPEEKAVIDLGLTMDRLPDGKLWRGKGCEACLNSGYRERVGIYELLPIDDTIRSQIVRQDSSSDIKSSAVQRGTLKTLRMDGALKALAGLTTVEEVMRVTQRDSF